MRYLVIGILSVLLLGCQNNSEQTKNKLTIVCTTGIIADGVKQIVKDSANVISLMGPGVDPHLYIASQSDMQNISNADIIIYNGLHLEGKMVKILEKLSRSKTVLALADGVDTTQLIRSAAFGNNFDPHIWFDVKIWKSGLMYLASKLSSIDVKNNAYYSQNAQNLGNNLDSLDSQIDVLSNTLPIEKKIIVTSHDAFRYYGKRYAFEVRGLQGISTLSDYGLKDVTDLVDFVVKNKIKAIFVESSVSKKSINAVIEGCKQVNHEVVIGGELFSDAMGQEGTKEGTYNGMLLHNTNLIVNSLK